MVPRNLLREHRGKCENKIRSFVRQVKLQVRLCKEFCKASKAV